MRQRCAYRWMESRSYNLTFCNVLGQMTVLGRAANAAILKQERGFDVVAPKSHSNPWR